MPPTTLDERWQSLGALRVHARVRDDLAPAGRPPIVGLHGQVVSSTYLTPVLGELATDFPVYAPDMPGFGRTTDPGANLSVDGLADFVARWLDEVGLDDVVLLGNSFGCQVAAAVAARHGDRIGRVVLQGPTMEPSRRRVTTAVWRGLVNALLEPPLGKVYRDDYRAAGFSRSLATFRMVLEDRLEERAPDMPMPTLLVRGTRDLLVSRAWLDTLAHLLPDGHVVELPGAAHTIVTHEPRRLAAVVTRFVLDGQTVAPPPPSPGNTSGAPA